MDNLEEKINSVLSSPDSLAKVLSLARSLSSDSEKEDEDGSHSPAADNNPLAGILGALSGGSGEGDGEGLAGISQLLGQLGPDTLPFLLKLLGIYNGKEDSRAAVLRALHPYLGKLRRGKVERVIQYMRIAKTIKAALEYFK